MDTAHQAITTSITQSAAHLVHPLTVEFPQEAARRGLKIAPSSPRPAPSSRLGSRIGIKVNGRIRFIDAADLAVVEAEGNYVTLQLRSWSCMLRESISAVEKKLAPLGFVRIHRSVLVNAILVEEVEPCTTGEYVLRLKGGKQYTVTRTYKKNLQYLASAWIGKNFDQE